MTELERRALMGDKKAQEELTEIGLVLPCPFCGSSKSKQRYACGDYFIECLKCHCTSSLTSTKETVLRDWNTRTAPPAGKCADCLKKPLCIIYRDARDDNGFCKWFAPKGGEENEN